MSTIEQRSTEPFEAPQGDPNFLLINGGNGGVETIVPEVEQTLSHAQFMEAYITRLREGRDPDGFLQAGILKAATPEDLKVPPEADKQFIEDTHREYVERIERELLGKRKKGEVSAATFLQNALDLTKTAEDLALEATPEEPKYHIVIASKEEPSNLASRLKAKAVALVQGAFYNKNVRGYASKADNRQQAINGFLDTTSDNLRKVVKEPGRIRDGISNLYAGAGARTTTIINKVGSGVQSIKEHYMGSPDGEPVDRSELLNRRGRAAAGVALAGILVPCVLVILDKKSGGNLATNLHQHASNASYAATAQASPKIDAFKKIDGWMRTADVFKPPVKTHIAHSIGHAAMGHTETLGKNGTLVGDEKRDLSRLGFKPTNFNADRVAGAILHARHLSWHAAHFFQAHFKFEEPSLDALKKILNVKKLLKK